MAKYKGETCDECGSDQTYLVTLMPVDESGQLIFGKSRWQCTNCAHFFLVDN